MPLPSPHVIPPDTIHFLTEVVLLIRVLVASIKSSARMIATMTAVSDQAIGMAVELANASEKANVAILIHIATV